MWFLVCEAARREPAIMVEALYYKGDDYMT